MLSEQRVSDAGDAPCAFRVAGFYCIIFHCLEFVAWINKNSVRVGAGVRAVCLLRCIDCFTCGVGIILASFVCAHLAVPNNVCKLSRQHCFASATFFAPPPLFSIFGFEFPFAQSQKQCACEHLFCRINVCSG